MKEYKVLISFDEALKIYSFEEVIKKPLFHCRNTNIELILIKTLSETEHLVKVKNANHSIFKRVDFDECLIELSFYKKEDVEQHKFYKEQTLFDDATK